MVSKNSSSSAKSLPPLPVASPKNVCWDSQNNDSDANISERRRGDTHRKQRLKSPKKKRNDRERTVMSDKKKNIKVIELYFRLTKANKHKKPVKF